MKTFLLITILALSFSGCISRAPTTYELDMRAGFNTPGAPILPDDLNKLHTKASASKAAAIPIRTPALVEKIWVADISLADGAKLQGTWLFLEVEPGRWVEEGQ